MKYTSAVLVATLAVILFARGSAIAGTPAPTTVTLQGDSARPEAAHWIRNELYFGVGTVDAPDRSIADIRWQAFLDREVTPRFPDGLTVLNAYGQWRGQPGETPSRLRSKVLIILCDDTPANRASIDAIRLAYKTATHDQSVLLATEKVDVSF